MIFSCVTSTVDTFKLLIIIKAIAWLYFAFFLSQEIYKDRKKFSKEVFEVASSDLVNMGITVVSYTLKDIRDEEVSCTILINKKFLQIYKLLKYIDTQMTKVYNLNV